MGGSSGGKREDEGRDVEASDDADEDERGGISDMGGGRGAEV